MKKRFLFLLTPALLMATLTGCDDKKSTPSPSVPPATSPTSPDTSDTGSVYVMPATAKEMYEALVGSTDTTYVGFIAKVVGIQQYSNSQNVNLYMQNGDYGFRVNNVPSGTVQLNKTYKVLGYSVGSSKAYYGINYNAKAGTGTIELAEDVKADAKAWSTTIDKEAYCSGRVTGSGTITKVENAKITVQSGTDEVVLSWLTGTIGGAAVEAKLGTLYVGQTVTFAGSLYSKSSLDVSILEADDITVSEMTFNGAISATTQTTLPSNTNLTTAVADSTVTYSGEVGWSLVDPTNRYDRGNVVGVKVTKHASLPSLSNVSLKVVELDGTTTSYTNAQLVEKEWIVADGIELFANLTGKTPAGKKIEVIINWGANVKEQKVIMAFDSGLTLAAEPTERLDATVLTTDVLASTYDAGTGTLLVGGGETEAKELPWVAGKGNALTLSLTAPTGYVGSQVNYTLSKNEETIKSHVSFDGLTTDGDVVKEELVFAKVTDVYTIVVRWKDGMLGQTITIKLDEKITLQANPDVADQTTLKLVTADVATANGWANATQYKDYITGDENITIALSGTLTNSGKYYSSGQGWRIYGSEATHLVTISSTTKTIVSVKVSYTNVKNVPTISSNGATYTTDQVIEVNAASMTFNFTGGNAAVTGFEIIYK